MSLADLSSILWRERELLELLLFKLEEEQLILATSRPRWLAHATREVEVVLDQIRRTEVLRATEVQGVGDELGCGDNPSLTELAERSPEPWSDLLREHRRTFVRLTTEVAELAEANQGLLTSGQRAVRDAMLVLTENVESYDRRGETVATGPLPRLLDAAM
ncbi:MAG TPA: flagellar export chaperone FlgN [Micromonosporaceae bacterium]|nr:flagellar export chaperone FlgN [Micromonosporaceae bacterium]